MKKYKCNGCGKIHLTKPEACDCGSDKGFTEVIVEIQKEKDPIDLEAMKAEWLKEQEVETQKKIDGLLKARGYFKTLGVKIE